MENKQNSPASGEEGSWVKKGFLLATGLLWGASVFAGLKVIVEYKNTPGPAAAAPRRWPGASHLVLSSEQPTLVMTVHPQCPCTRASVGELARLTSSLQGRVKTYVLFMKPQGFSQEWAKTDIWHNARRIPGVTTVVDEEGKEMAFFGAETSGHVFLYNPDGTLMFSGGITPRRAHEGDNVGRERIIQLVRGERAERRESPVYGCALNDPVNSSKKGEKRWTL
jgi:hypothetical protein